MGHSRLELYINILKSLSYRNPLKLSHIINKVEVERTELKECLGSLARHGLVKKRTVGKRTVAYVTSQRGRKVLKYFQELERNLPNLEESEEKPAAS
jgi:predicted transcriptional regulator